MKRLLAGLTEKRGQIASTKIYLDGLKKEKQAIEDKVLEAMNDQELKSARYDNMTATIAERKTLSVTNEKEVVDYLKGKGLTDYLSERPNDLFGVFKKEAEKQETEVPGMEMKKTEYLSIRVKKGDL